MSAPSLSLYVIQKDPHAYIPESEPVCMLKEFFMTADKENPENTFIGAAAEIRKTGLIDLLSCHRFHPDCLRDDPL